MAIYTLFIANLTDGFVTKAEMNAKGVQPLQHTIVITDKDNTAMTENADVKLFAKSSMASFVDSLAAPLSLINALLVTLGMHRREHIVNSFEALETLWSQYKVYEVGRDRNTEEEP